MNNSLLIVINDLGFFISHRLPIAVAAQKSGLDVHVAYGVADTTAVDENIFAQGFLFHPIPLRRSGLNPMAELRTVICLWRLFLRVKPNIVHLVTIKPVLYGGIAARLAKVPAAVIAMAGMGFTFTRRVGFKAMFLRWIMKPLFRLALRHPNQSLIFQHVDDLKQVLALVETEPKRIRVIRGSGVNFLDHPALPEPRGVPIVAMASRLLRDKGVGEFMQAARILRKRSVSARFWLIGKPDPSNPTSITGAQVAEGVVEYLGYRTDVPQLYGQAHIVTLPSYYGEGVPKSLIEAAATGRAVVTTDMPGCRDAIEPNVTGLLVPARDAVALANALQHLIENAELRRSLGKAGRKLAEREFGIEKVVDAHLQVYQELLDAC